MNTFDICVMIRRTLLNRAAEVVAYKSWSDEFARGHLDELHTKLTEQTWFSAVNPNELTAEEMKQLGFQMWSESTPYYLIPLWLLPYLAETFQGYCISDDDQQLLLKSEMDNDNRSGMLAYGVVPSPTITSTL